jgi:hypothetical protein
MLGKTKIVRMWPTQKMSFLEGVPPVLTLSSKATKGRLRRYLKRMTGPSRAQVTRVIAAYVETGCDLPWALHFALPALRVGSSSGNGLLRTEKRNGIMDPVRP